jgi:hypothetical protein
MCRRCDCPRLIRPDAVTLNRFAAPRLVFNLGIFHSLIINVTVATKQAMPCRTSSNYRLQEYCNLKAAEIDPARFNMNPVAVRFTAIE